MTVNAKSLVADALGLTPAEITDDTSLATTDAWDSLAHFRLVLALEETIGRPLDPIEITTLSDMKTVAAILDAA